MLLLLWYCFWYDLQIHVHDTAESLYKAVGMEVLPDEYLPDDYTGPSAGPLPQIIRTFCTVSLLTAFISRFSTIMLRYTTYVYLSVFLTARRVPAFLF